MFSIIKANGSTIVLSNEVNILMDYDSSGKRKNMIFFRSYFSISSYIKFPTFFHTLNFSIIHTISIRFFHAINFILTLFLDI